MHPLVRIQFLDLFQNLNFGSGVGIVESEGIDAAFLAGFFLHADVGLGVPAGSDEDDGQARGGGEGGDSLFEFEADCGCDCLSVDVG